MLRLAVVFPLVVILLLAQVDPERDWTDRHKREDDNWAARTRLSPEVIRQLRIAAGIPDETDAAVDYIDTRSLRSRNHILLVEVSGGNGHCLNLHVLQSMAKGFVPVWSLDKMPNGPGGICRLSPVNPSAHADKSGRIVLEVPVYDDLLQRTMPTKRFTYVWIEDNYVLSSHSAR